MLTTVAGEGQLAPTSTQANLTDSSAMGTGREDYIQSPVSILEVPLGLHQVPSLG